MKTWITTSSLVEVARGKGTPHGTITSRPQGRRKPGGMTDWGSLWEFWFSDAPNQLRACVLSRFSPVQLCVTPWTVAHQAPLSMEFSRQEYWSGFPFSSPGDLPDPEIEPFCLLCLLHWQASSLPGEPPKKPQTTYVR